MIFANIKKKNSTQSGNIFFSFVILNFCAAYTTRCLFVRIETAAAVSKYSDLMLTHGSRLLTKELTAARCQ